MEKTTQEVMTDRLMILSNDRIGLSYVKEWDFDALRLAVIYQLVTISDNGAVVLTQAGRDHVKAWRG
jgi:hypothetical protein